jgi:hypothetical protein
MGGLLFVFVGWQQNLLVIVVGQGGKKMGMPDEKDEEISEEQSG